MRSASAGRGIVEGVGNHKFEPDRDVSIGEFCAMAVRVANITSVIDTPESTPWSKKYVDYVKNIMKITLPPGNLTDVIQRQYAFHIAWKIVASKKRTIYLYSDGLYHDYFSVFRDRDSISDASHRESAYQLVRNHIVAGRMSRVDGHTIRELVPTAAFTRAEASKILSLCIATEAGINEALNTIPIEKTYYGMIRPMSGVDRSYAGDTGMDIAATKGTPIYAAASGIIRYSYYEKNDPFSPQNGYPNDTPYRIRIKLDIPVMFEGITYEDNFYTHLSGIVYNKGRNENKTIHVRQGELIGYCGSGRHNVHLHFGIYTDFSSNEQSLRVPKIQQLFGSSYGTTWIAGK